MRLSTCPLQWARRMAKPLRDPSPSSSVARLLDTDAAARAVSPGAPPRLTLDLTRECGDPRMELSSRDHSIVTPSTAPLDAATLIKREFILDATADASLNQLIDLLRNATGARLSGSHVVRAVLHGIAACTESLRREAAEIGRLKLPSNARGRGDERRRFEGTIAAAIINGIRAASALRSVRDD